MGRELVIAWAGRRRRDGWERLCQRYRERIGSWMPVRELPVRVRDRQDPGGRLEDEGRAILGAMPDPCWVVALDRRGRARTSLELAGWLRRLLDRWPHPVAFVVGSDLGLSAGLLAAARERLSFGPMTLPHELARLVLYEQLYRCLSIDAGIKYHRQPL